MAAMAVDARAERRAERRVEWLSRVGALLVRVLGRTWRIRVSHDDDVRRLRAAGTPIVFVIWHGQLLPLLYQHRDERVAVLISEHGDGEIIARIATRLGYQTVRGSTSRGAARALLGLARVVGEGNDLAITPDGPRGPAKSLAPGAVIVAHRTGAPLIAAAVSVSRAWRLKSWDQFVIPKPFARLHFAYSGPTTVTVAQGRDAAAETDRMREAFDLAERRANE
jgi:lysophospholipid acyltransferase (LPLAT)-like uncharacterized protein